MLTQAELKAVLHYDPETGVFTRLVSPSPRWVGQKTKGTKDVRGYRKLETCGREYMVHGLVWLYMTGEWRNGEITHVNGDFGDNRWLNLAIRDYGTYEHELSLAEIKELLAYDADTGLFRWRRKIADRTVVGEVAGTLSHGYVTIKIRVARYLAHRLAWAFSHGEMPSKFVDIDHINGNRSDNRIANLRLATRGENLRNTPLRRDNTSGTKCVSWSKERNKWIVKIGVDCRYVHVGYFEDKAEAVAAYRAAAVRLHGEYARLE